MRSGPCRPINYRSSPSNPKQAFAVFIQRSFQTRPEWSARVELRATVDRIIYASGDRSPSCRVATGSVVVVTEKSGPAVLVCASMWWPLSARLATAFIRHGCRVSAVCPPGHPLRFVTGIESVFPYRALNSIGSLKSAILDARPTLIVPCDDSVVWQLHELHTGNPELQSLIERSLGANNAYPVLRNRAAFLQVAADLEVRVPATRVLTSEEELDDWRADGPAVLKRDGTWGGSGVAIVRSLPSALAAFRRLSFWELFRSRF